MASEGRIPHNLPVHLEFADHVLELRYSYPHSRPHQLREQVISIAFPDISDPIRKELLFLRSELLGQLQPPAPVRLPSLELLPERRPGFLTVVIQDPTRELPVARLYVMEVVEVLDSRVEIELRLDPGQWSEEQLASWRTLRQLARGIVWSDYLKRFGGADSPTIGAQWLGSKELDEI